MLMNEISLPSLRSVSNADMISSGTLKGHWPKWIKHQIKWNFKPGMVVYTWNPNTQEAETRGSRMQSQPGIHNLPCLNLSPKISFQVFDCIWEIGNYMLYTELQCVLLVAHTCEITVDSLRGRVVNLSLENLYLMPSNPTPVLALRNSFINYPKLGFGYFHVFCIVFL